MVQNLHPTFYGYLLLILGFGLILLLVLILRWLPRLQKDNLSSPRSPNFTKGSLEKLPAVIHVRPGGRITYINQEAKDLFKLHQKSASLDHLAHCTQPSEHFLSLCAQEGQATFSLHGRLVEGISIPVPTSLGADQEPGMLVSLYQPSLHPGLTCSPVQFSDDKQIGPKQERKAPSTHTLSQLTKISREITGNLDVEKTIQAILNNCKLLLPADFLEITVWENPTLSSQSFCLSGDVDGQNSIQLSPHRFSEGHGYGAWLVARREPLLVDHVQDSAEIRSDLDHSRYPYRSYLGYPIMDGRKLVAVVEFASLEEELYSLEDLHTLQFFEGQIATALQHAFSFRSERRKALEFTGLADLTQAINAIQDPQDLFFHLIESISPLIDVQVLGFVVLDEARRILTAQLPFKGVHSPSVVEWYQFELRPDSPAEEIWQNAETIIAVDASADKRLSAFELDQFARMVGIHECVLSPLATGGQMVGFLLAGNKTDGTSFNQDDVRFLNIISGKAAPIIANANLVRISRQRAQRAEVLRRVASLARSNATFDEILKFTTLDLARLLQADVAAVFLLDTQGQELKLHPESAFGISTKVYPGLSRIAVQDEDFRQTVCYSQKLLLTGDLEKLVSVPKLYLPFSQALKIRSLAAIPLFYKASGIGELIFGSQRSNFFSNHDVQTAITAFELIMAGFSSDGRRDKAAPYPQVKDQSERGQLALDASFEIEKQQFAALKREQRKTDTLLQVFTELSTSLDLKHIFQATSKVLESYSGAHDISIWVYQNEKPGSRALTRLGQPTPASGIEDSQDGGLDLELAETVVRHASPMFIEDILQEPAWVSRLAEYQNSRISRSVLGAPLVHGAEVLGCLLLLHPDRGYFSVDQLDLIQAVAYQISMTINHINLFQLIHDQAEEFGALLRNQKVETSQTKAILESVADGVLVTDAEQKITLFNHSAEEILNLDSSEVIDKSIEEFLGLFGGSAPKWMQTIAEWTAQPDSYQPGETFAQQIHLDDGRIISVRLAPAFLNNDFIGTVSIFQDISHQVEVDRLKSEFVATVSHELRTPMTSIKGYVDVLLMGVAGALSEQQTGFLKIVKSNADRLSVLVDSLLDISRIEAGRNVLALQPISLEEIIDQVLGDYEQIAREENRTIVFSKSLPTDLPPVVGDYERAR